MGHAIVWAGALCGVITLLPPIGAVARQARPSEGRWVTAWGTSHQTQATSTVSNATVRLIARPTIGGDAVRIRLANTFGAKAVAIEQAFVGRRQQGAALVAGSNRPLRFGGAQRVSIPAGGAVESDALEMPVVAREDLAVSLYIAEQDARPSQHTGAVVTSYMTPNGSGNAAASEARDAFKETTTSTLWLKAIDVRSTSSSGAIVAFGDSITDGTCTTLDAYDRWEDWLAVRLHAAARQKGTTTPFKAVVNEGIGGNTVTREGLQPPPDSTPGVERLDRDVFSHQGVTHVAVFMGTNDLRRGASAQQVIDGLQDITKRIKARSLKAIGVTIIPRHNVPPSETNTGWNDAKSKNRHEVNRWIRTEASFDGVIDFEKVVRDATNPDLIVAPFNCDGIHPNPRGYYEMGWTVPLDLFTR
jgi:lysophospholipase L1-like esterase